MYKMNNFKPENAIFPGIANSSRDINVAQNEPDEIKAKQTLVYAEARAEFSKLIQISNDKSSRLEADLSLNSRVKVASIDAALAETNILKAQLLALEKENDLIVDLADSIQSEIESCKATNGGNDKVPYLACWKIKMLKSRVFHFERRMRARLPVLAFQHQIVDSVSNNLVSNYDIS